MINKSIFLKVGKIVAISIFLLIFNCFLWAIIYQLWIFKAFELDGLDFLFNFRGKIYNPPEEIVIVDINDQVIKELGREWPRSYYAKVIDYLAKGGAKVIGFDILFSEPSKIFPEGDKELAEATERAGNVCHSILFTEERFMDKRFCKLNPSTSTAKNLARFFYGKYDYDFSEFMRHSGYTLAPIEPIFEKTKSIGYINYWSDSDGVVRRMQPLTVCYIRDDKAHSEYKAYPEYPSFSLQVACDYLGIKKEDVSIVSGKFIDLKKIRIPVDRDGAMVINYQFYSFRHIPFSLVLKGEIPAGFFKDKIVLIGGTAAALFDNVATPINPSMPGVDVHANIIHSIIHNDFIYPVGKATNIIICLLLALLVGLVSVFLRPLKSLVVVLLLLIGYIVLVFFLFEKGIYLEVVRPIAMIVFVRILFLEKSLIGKPKTFYQ